MFSRTSVVEYLFANIPSINALKPMIRHKLHASALFFLIVSGFCEFALSQEVKIVDYGIYTGRLDNILKDPNSPTGQMRTEWTDLAKQTDAVPAALKTKFGFRFKITGLPEGTTTWLRLQFTFPEMTNPTTGKVSSSYEFSSNVPVGTKELGMYWDFTHPWEMRPGKWTMRIYRGDRLLAEKIFTVAEENEGGRDKREPINHLTVYNKGRCGQNSGIVREKFEDDVLKLTPKPNYVFIYIVATDVINDRFFTTVEKHLENMTWMIEQARKAGIKPVICTSHHVVESVVYAHHSRDKFGKETVNEKIDRYNAALRKFAKDQEIGLADFGAAAKDVPPSDLLSDGVHLTFLGNKLLAKTFFDVIAPQLHGQETIVCLGDSLTFGYLNKGAGSTEGETYPAMLRQFPIPSTPSSSGSEIREEK
jgi:lysophospholipase L1-like esterase